MQLQQKSAERPTTLSVAEESIVTVAILYYAKNNPPLFRWGVMDLDKKTITLSASDRRWDIGIGSERPTPNWTDNFTRRHDLKALSVQSLRKKGWQLSQTVKY